MAALICVSLIVLVVGRNYATGARFNFGEVVHVMEPGERANYHVAPNSYMPSNYVKIDSMTWISWNEESAWGFGRISAAWPDGTAGDQGWARIGASCPLGGGDEMYFSEYSIDWLDGDKSRNIDGWEGGDIKIVDGECME